MLVIVSAVFKQKQRLFLNSYLISSQKRPKGASFRSFSVVFLSFSVNFAIKAERSLRRDSRGVRKAARVIMKLCKAERGLPRRREAQRLFFFFPPAVPNRHSSPPHKSHPSSAARPKRAARLIFARSSSEDRISCAAHAGTGRAANPPALAPRRPRQCASHRAAPSGRSRAQTALRST